MDKNEYQAKLEELKNLYAEEDYESAAAIADEISWRRVRNVNTLCMVGDIYEHLGRYKECRSVLMMAYDKSPVGKNIAYNLTMAAIKYSDVKEAREFYSEFVDIAKGDPRKYILKYKLAQKENAPLVDRVAILEELKDHDYTEEWAYELARLYYRTNELDKCADTCDEMIVWFGDGAYVKKAKELKRACQPLISEQGRVHVVDVQTELKRRIEKISDAKDKDAVAEMMNGIQKMISEIPGLQSSLDNVTTVDTPKVAAYETEADINRSLAENFNEMISEEEDGQMSFYAGRSGQVSGQMAIEDVLKEWEYTKRVAEAALAEADERMLQAAKARAVQETEELIQKLDAIPPVLEIPAIPEPEPEITVEEITEALQEETIDSEALADSTQESVDEIAESVTATILSEENKANAIIPNPMAETRPVNLEKDEMAEISADAATKEFEIPDFVAETAQAVEGAVAAEEGTAEAEEEIPEETEEIAEEAEEAAETEEEAPDASKEMINQAEEATLKAIEKLDTFSAGISAMLRDASKSTKGSIDSVLAKVKAKTVEPAAEESPTEEVTAEEVPAEETAEEVTAVEEEVAAEEIPVEETAAEEEAPVEEAVTAEEETPVEEAPAAEEETPVEEAPTAEENAPVEEAAPADTEEKQHAHTEEEIEAVRQQSTARIHLQMTGSLPQVGLRLDEDVRDYFSYFLAVPGMEAQIASVLADVPARKGNDVTSSTGNIVIQGATGSGKTVLATNLIRAFGRSGGKTGKIQAKTLNHKNPKDILSKVKGGYLIVENAGDMTAETASKLAEAMIENTAGLTVILEDTKYGIRRALALSDNLARRFTEKINIPIFTIDELVIFAKSYAAELDCVIDELGILALYNRINQVQKKEDATTLMEVKDIMDAAIESAERGAKKMFGKKSYDKDDNLILHEKDFA